VTLTDGDVFIVDTFNDGGALDGLVVTALVDGARDLSLTVTDTTVFAAGANIGAGTAVGDGTGASLTINSAGTTSFGGTSGQRPGSVR